MKRVFTIAAVIVAITLAGCGSPAGTGGQAQPAESPVPPVASAPVQRPAPPKPTAVVKAPMPDTLLNAGAGVTNGGFEDWAEKRPVNWSMRPGLEKYVSPEATEKVGGTTSLKVAGPYSYTHVFQNVTIEGDSGGKTATLKLQAKCSEPKTLSVAIALENGRQFYSQPHPGDGEWQELVATCAVPPDYQGTALKVLIDHHGNPKQPVFIDDVTLTIE
ncbi:MAG: hypothetical protein HY706_07300 [Candidatus Hydrogenedentes bacterium]|nr:hypothetical protein [Candidatus Hydrogenedentota bacterium]